MAVPATLILNRSISMIIYNPEKHYHGSQCAKCAGTIRYTVNHSCVQCARNNTQKHIKAGKSYYGPEAQLRRDLKRKYGITLETYNEMLTEQNHSCACCGKHTDNEHHRLAVDHDHTTGSVRALLCSNCNRALGFAQDDPNLLRKMADYLESH